MKKTPKISVIIPTLNSYQTLLACISSILKQSYRAKEIIIVDNASTDKTKEEILKLNKKHKVIKYFRNIKNLGVTGGRNRGIEESSKSSDFLCFLDHDMVADRKMLEELYKTSLKRKKIAVVTPKIYYWDKKDILWSAGTEINLTTGFNVFRNGKDRGQFDRDEEISIAPAVLFVKKKVIVEIGIFDDRFFAVYEDSEYCYRAKRSGYLNYYSSNAVAYHKIPYDFEDSMKRLVTRLYWIGRNRTLFMKIYGKNYFLYLLISPFYFFYYAFLSIKYGKFSSFFDYIHGFLDAL